MLETSKDVLYIVLSFCALWLTIFFCWVIYYLAMLLKQAYDLTRTIREKVDKVEGLIDAAKQKLERSSSHLALIAEGVGQLIGFVVSRRAESKGSGATQGKKAKRK